MIRVGIAGWDYPDWQGPVYPARAGRGFDRLAYISRYVDVIEINRTFYRPITARTAQSWIDRTSERPDLRFTAKAHRSWTHEVASDPGSQIQTTLEGFRPLLEADRLGAILVQFPQSFRFCAESLQRLSRLTERLTDWPVAVEVRHASWNDDRAEQWLRERRVAWCLVDQPRAQGATIPPLPWVTARMGYMRLHGRNEANWFRENAGRDARYDYLYPPAELETLVGHARGMADQCEELFVIQNNHFRGKALVNTLQLKRRITGQQPRAPESLVDVYPDLDDDVTVHKTRLF